MSRNVKSNIKKLPVTEAFCSDFTPEDRVFMGEALAEANAAAEMGEVPVGAVIVHGNQIIARGRNAREADKNALAHAEISAINAACRALGGWRLPDCTLYVTMEPCPMCAGAIINARLPKVVCAVRDSKAGAFGSVLNFNSYPLNHKPDVSYGLMEDEARALLSSFFLRLRRK